MNSERDWQYEVEENIQHDSSTILCMKLGVVHDQMQDKGTNRDNSGEDCDEIDELLERIELYPDCTPWEWTLTAIERLWENRIIWKHTQFTTHHELQLQLTADLETAYQDWKASSSLIRRRRTLMCELPVLGQTN